MSRQGGAYYEDGRDAASDYYSQLAGRFGEALPAIRRRGKMIERTARDHPATAAAVGLVVIGLVASLLLQPEVVRPQLKFRRCRALVAFSGQTR